MPTLVRARRRLAAKRSWGLSMRRFFETDDRNSTDSRFPRDCAGREFRYLPVQRSPRFSGYLRRKR
jgi:hypothetical protein